MQNLFKDKQRLLKAYFILQKFYFAFSVIMLSTLFSGGFEWILLGAAFTGFVFIGVQVIAAHHAERMIQRKNYLGLLIALALNTMMLPSMFFWLSLIGYYSLLNPETRTNFPADQNPKWLNDFFRWLDEVTGKQSATAN